MKLNKTVFILLLLLIFVFLYSIGSWTVFPSTKTVEYPGEGIYTGQMRGQTFHGQGTWKSDFGVTYTGEFKNGFFHGTGTMTFSDGSTYTGEFKEGSMHGHGVMTFADGHTHEGYWDADQFLGDHEDCGHEHH